MPTRKLALSSKSSSESIGDEGAVRGSPAELALETCSKGCVERVWSVAC